MYERALGMSWVRSLDGFHTRGGSKIRRTVQIGKEKEQCKLIDEDEARDRFVGRE